VFALPYEDCIEALRPKLGERLTAGLEELFATRFDWVSLTEESADERFESASNLFFDVDHCLRQHRII
jgi:hypothetical protein